jgi:hypothetical protein
VPSDQAVALSPLLVALVQALAEAVWTPVSFWERISAALGEALVVHSPFVP